MKKPVSLLLSLFLLLTLLPSLAPQAAAANYDAAAAAAYADAHWDDGVGVCDQFVKACLKAGGITIKSGTVMGVYSELLNYGVSYQLTMAKDGYCYLKDNEGKIAVGDIVFFECSKHAVAHLKLHTGIVTKIDSNGKVLYSQHNGPIHNKGLGWFSDSSGHSGSDITYHVIHMNAAPRPEQLKDFNLSATADSLTVSWNDVANETGYDVYLAKSGFSGRFFDNVLTMQSVPTNSTSAVFTGLAPATYSVAIAAMPCDVNAEEHIISKSIYVGPYTPTVGQNEVRADEITDTNAKLHWTGWADCVDFFVHPWTWGGVSLRDEDGAEIGRYELRQDRNYGGEYNGITFWGHPFSDCDITQDMGLTLTPGTTYYFEFFKVFDYPEYHIELYSPIGSFTTTGRATATVSYLPGCDPAEFSGELPAVQIKDYNQSITLSDGAGMLRAGYTLVGWSEKPAALQAKYALGQKIDTALADDLILYGVWEAKPISEVHFEPQTLYFDGQFRDVPAEQWYTPYVETAFSLSLMKGKRDDVFDPYGNVTLAEAITMAARIHSIYTTGRETFVQTGVWYQVYLDYAYENGIIPYAFYNADVKRQATRAQFAQIFAKALPEEGLAAINDIADNAIPDVDMDMPYVYALYRAGILTGSDSLGTFHPKTYITRAEAAAIVSRMAESNYRKSFSLG